MYVMYSSELKLDYSNQNNYEARFMLIDNQESALIIPGRQKFKGNVKLVQSKLSKKLSELYIV